MTLNVAETVRKMMGWCPSAGTAMTENAMHFDHPVMNETDGGSSTHATIRWKNKYRNLILILAVLISINVINMFISFGASIIDVFLAGLIFGILLDVLTGQVVWNSLDRIPTRTPHKAARKLSIKRIVVFGIIIFLYVAAFSHFTSIYGWRSVAAFVSGFGLLMWLDYMHIVQWERKNQKTLVKKSWYAPLVAVSNGRHSQ
jgi:uncharacterized protein DUF1673